MMINLSDYHHSDRAFTNAIDILSDGMLSEKELDNSFLDFLMKDENTSTLEEEEAESFSSTCDKNSANIGSPDRNSCSKRRRGRLYLCPIEEDKFGIHVIKDSRLAEHIKRKHINVGGMSMQDMVVRIKNYTIEACGITDYEKCCFCGIPQRKNYMSKHLSRIHNEKPMSRSISLEEAKDQILRENSSSSNVILMNNEDFANCLNNWGGGKLSSGTIEKYTRYLQQLMTVTKVNNFFDLVLVPENRNSISDHLGLVAESSPSICTSTLAALSSLQRYLSCNKMTDICDRSLEPELKAFENQLVLWNRSNNSNKKADNARLRSELDDHLITEEDVINMNLVIAELRRVALQKNDAESLSLYLGAAFSFRDGNCNRPDVPSNATLSEFLAWKSELESAKNGEMPHFRVHSHKTCHIYGAQRVTISEENVPILLELGRIRLEKEGLAVAAHGYVTGSARRFQDSSPILMVFPGKGANFSSAWRRVRLANIKILNVTNTAYRHYIETKGKEELNVEEQAALNDRLAHRGHVARQNYQATTQRLADRGSCLVKSLLESDRTIEETGEQIKESDRTIEETGEQNEESDRTIEETGEQIKGSSSKLKLRRCPKLSSKALMMWASSKDQMETNVNSDVCSACECEFEEYEGPDWSRCTTCEKWYCGRCYKYTKKFVCRSCLPKWV